MILKFPQFDEKYNFKADEEEIEKLKEIIIGIRNLRASSNVHPSKKTELIFVTTKYKYLINQSEGFLKKLLLKLKEQVKCFQIQDLLIKLQKLKLMKKKQNLKNIKIC